MLPNILTGYEFIKAENVPALIISLCTLTFTIASFWWLNARQGKLKGFPPQTFAMKHDTRTLIRVPFAVHNTGPKPIVVRDIKLRCFTNDREFCEFSWKMTPSNLDPTMDRAAPSKLPAVFVLQGHSAHELVIEFAGNFLHSDNRQECCTTEILALLGHKNSWASLSRFNLHLERTKKQDRYTPYLNSAKQSDGLSKVTEQ
jgi:hypothetical protein